MLTAGRKQFTIFPPDEFDRLYLYPEAHPRARKSQVKLESDLSNQRAVDGGGSGGIYDWTEPVQRLRVRLQRSLNARI